MVEETQALEIKESKSLTASEIGQRLVVILDGLLKTGNWENSLFLRASANRLRQLKDEAQRLAQSGASAQGVRLQDAKDKIFAAGYIQVYVYLYQVDGSSLRNWQSAIKSLMEHSSSRPAYKTEEHVQEFIRSKTDLERHGYVVVNIKESDVYKLGSTPMDPLGHPLLTLKDDAIKLENIYRFIHANKKTYIVQEQQLIYETDIKI